MQLTKSQFLLYNKEIKFYNLKEVESNPFKNTTYFIVNCEILNNLTFNLLYFHNIKKIIQTNIAEKIKIENRKKMYY